MELGQHTRRKCFISYHHDDEYEVQQFIQDFDHDQDVLIARGIGASMAGDIINSTNEDYIKARIRENRSGLLAITLPSAADYYDKKLPARVWDNIMGVSGADGYARWWKYPSSASSLANLIETAYDARSSRAHLVDNNPDLPEFWRNADAASQSGQKWTLRYERLRLGGSIVAALGAAFSLPVGRIDLAASAILLGFMVALIAELAAWAHKPA
ncbi:hypothetical protein CTheo_9139 [Ceratobasidium theobromae]|uniref:SMODS and SLOG-associating 2TM effector domain-containing protein n=1 Tax=Ceratobasidium theobromae TaxID=1582974 RepID=A0A5N5Q7G7_9AGAM|nr:hypothetical protein CTheo_9139 [Ceratobasidium theobromae]